jgi:hypothetical protein
MLRVDVWTVVQAARVWDLVRDGKGANVKTKQDII